MTAIITAPETVNALAVEAPLAQRLGLTESKLAIVRSQIAYGAPDDVLELFFERCRAYGADPFAKLIYLIPRKSSRYNATLDKWEKGVITWTFQSSIDFFRARAQSSGVYRGQKGPFWCGPDGVWTDVWLQMIPPSAAKVAVLRADFDEPLWAVAKFSSYKQTDYDGALTGQWKSMPELMVAKVAEALALRKAFPETLQGLYTGEEMDQAGESATLGSGAADAPVAEGEAPRRGRKAKVDPNVDVPPPSVVPVVVTMPMLTTLYADLRAKNPSLPEKLGGWMALNGELWMDPDALALGDRPRKILTETETMRVKKAFDEYAALLVDMAAADTKPVDASDAEFEPIDPDDGETQADGLRELELEARIPSSFRTPTPQDDDETPFPTEHPSGAVDAPQSAATVDHAPRPAVEGTYPPDMKTTTAQRIRIAKVQKALQMPDIEYRSILKRYSASGAATTTEMTANESHAAFSYMAQLAESQGVKVDLA